MVRVGALGTLGHSRSDASEFNCPYGSTSLKAAGHIHDGAILPGLVGEFSGFKISRWKVVMSTSFFLTHIFSSSFNCGFSLDSFSRT